jgi:3-phenylpropionate/cinnamic acid dioxygenase small subunit
MTESAQDLFARIQAPPQVRRPTVGRRIGYSDPAYGEAMDFLIDEATLLDEDDLRGWLALLSQDIFYWMPVRQTVMRKQGPGFDPRMAFFYDSYSSLQKRISRITDFENAHSEDPPSRTRRNVGGLRLHETSVPDQLRAETNILLMRNRGDAKQYDLISARRHDLLVRTLNGLRLSQRIILVDQPIMGTPNMGIFL